MPHASTIQRHEVDSVLNSQKDIASNIRELRSVNLNILVLQNIHTRVVTKINEFLPSLIANVLKFRILCRIVTSIVGEKLV